MSGGLKDPLTGSGNHHNLEFEPIEPLKTPPKKEVKRSSIEEKLDLKLSNLKESDNLMRVLVQVISICAISSFNGRDLSRKQIMKMIPDILERTKISASTYNSYTVYALTAVGAAVTIGCSGYAAYKFSTEVASGLATNLNGQLLSAKIQWISSLQSAGSAAGQVSGTAGQLRSQYLTGEREVYTSVIQLLTLQRDRLREMDGSDARKSAEFMDMCLKVIEAYHRSCMQASGGQ